MDGAFDIISLVVSSTFNLGSLIMSYLAWRSTQTSAPQVQITLDHRVIAILDGTIEATEDLLSKADQMSKACQPDREQNAES